MKKITGMLLVAVLMFSMPANVLAFAGPNPNIIRKMNLPNPRKPVGANARYKYNSRGIERSRLKVDDTVEAGDNLGTFDGRARTLRNTQLRRIDEDLKMREFNREQRKTFNLGNPTNRSSDTTKRRVEEAKNANPGVADQKIYRRFQRAINRTPEEVEKQLNDIQKYRRQAQEREASQYSPVEKVKSCTGLSGSRLAKCHYQIRTTGEYKRN